MCIRDSNHAVQASKIQQYPVSLKTSIIRLMLSKGAKVEEIRYDYPVPDNELYHYIFGHSGGATYKTMPEAVTSKHEGKWFFNANFQMEGAGVNGARGSEIIAFLPHLKREICVQINKNIGLRGIPKFNAPAEDAEIISSITSKGLRHSEFSNGNKPFLQLSSGNSKYGCFKEDTLGYVYYHLLIER